MQPWCHFPCFEPCIRLLLWKPSPATVVGRCYSILPRKHVLRGFASLPRGRLALYFASFRLRGGPSLQGVPQKRERATLLSLDLLMAWPFLRALLSHRRSQAPLRFFKRMFSRSGLGRARTSCSCTIRSICWRPDFSCRRPLRTLGTRCTRHRHRAGCVYSRVYSHDMTGMKRARKPAIQQAVFKQRRVR